MNANWLVNASACPKKAERNQHVITEEWAIADIQFFNGSKMTINSLILNISCFLRVFDLLAAQSQDRKHF